MVALFCILPGLSLAQAPQFKVVNLGISTHTHHGQGIEIQVSPSQDLPADKAVLEPILADLCRAFGAKAIARVIEASDITDPNFIGVRLFLSPGRAGRYIFEAYRIEAGQCGDPF